ncbi:MAG: hypothetical protein LBJ17_08510 [Dysgonamonadaceae bacterium]|jgi:hypothetical protein|nr:hypothetical protein [Dysgonamonadaceae bacterium]
MSFNKKIEHYLEQISILEASFRQVKDLNPLPVSFFSASLDILNQLQIGLDELESSQLQLMTVNATDSFTEEPIRSLFLGDKIGKKIYADLTKSLTLNQRFMFLRDLFKGNEPEMNRTLTHLNDLTLLEDALHYLNHNHPVQWETESGMAFKELLEKRFT